MQNTKGKFGISEFDIYLFREGTNCEAYNMLGARKYEHKGTLGTRFSVWAPNAKEVFVVGDFNNWEKGKTSLEKIDSSGIWAGFEGGVSSGFYKFEIIDKDGNSFLKTDPYAFSMGLRPDTAGRIYHEEFSWSDEEWMKNKKSPLGAPVNIYEVHLGSWRREGEGENDFYSYKRSAKELIKYVKKMGYTHIELLPVTEYPFDNSWGYQVSGYFAPTSRYGSPKEFAAFVNECHKNKIGVIMDWVPAHFPKDSSFLAKFDGSCLYEYEDERKGEHKEWGTLVFNYERGEVISFLLSSANFWCEKYHIDGLRVDAVSSMLYLDYNRKDGEWIKNKYGGNGNLEAVSFLQKLNANMFKRHKNILMIAEESTAWPLVTKPVESGGLGFNFKWNMGWMNDTLRYMSMDPYFRKFNHNILTFLMFYAFSENFILPLSHDEVVHGKASVLGKMFGEYEDKFRLIKAYYSYMFAHPGKKLNFMGNEFGQFSEWNSNKELDWCLLEYESHKKLKDFVKKLNEFYKTEPALYEVDDGWNGFSWINERDCENSVISFVRYAKDEKDFVIFVANFTPVLRTGYKIGVDKKGKYKIVLASEGKRVTKSAKKGECDGKDYYLSLNLPPNSAFFIKKAD